MTATGREWAPYIAWAVASTQAEVDAVLADPAHPTHAWCEALADAADHADEQVRGAGLAELFGAVVEPLNDSFSAGGRAAYAWWFAAVVWRASRRQADLAAALADAGIRSGADLRSRHAAVRRQAEPLPAEVRTIAVLSRVTIGADILLTTVAIQRLAQRYPRADIVLCGDGKLAGLLAGGETLPRLRVAPLAYSRRGGLGERLAAWRAVRDAVVACGADLVVSPDSRLDQLGLLPTAADPARHLLWENLQDGPPVSLADTCDRWFARRLGLPSAPPCLPRLALDAPVRQAAAVWTAACAGARWLAVKLDHGGNPAKALPRAGEVALRFAIRAPGWRIVLDRGFGPAERATSDALVAALGWQVLDVDDTGAGLGAPVEALPASCQDSVVRFHGSIAGWAAAVSACTCAFSYDSVGHHLAAALGVRVVVAFTGYADDRFPVAWQPRGAARVAVEVIPTARKDDPGVVDRLMAAIRA
jgi:ADP-heptose:LPS heptosyltransferase